MTPDDAGMLQTQVEVLVAKQTQLRAALTEIEEAIAEAEGRCFENPMAHARYDSFALGVIAAVAFRALYGGDDDA